MLTQATATQTTSTGALGAIIVIVAGWLFLRWAFATEKKPQLLSDEERDRLAKEAMKYMRQQTVIPGDPVDLQPHVRDKLCADRPDACAEVMRELSDVREWIMSCEQRDGTIQYAITDEGRRAPDPPPGPDSDTPQS